MDTGGTATSFAGSHPRLVTDRDSRLTGGLVAAIAALTCVTLCGTVLALSLSWGTRDTALTLAFTVSGLVATELTRRRTLSADAPWVSATAVWVIGAALTLPLAGVLVVSSVLTAHELLRRPGRTSDVRPLTWAASGTAGATLAWSAATFTATFTAAVTDGAVAAVLAGLLYVAATDGPALARTARRLVTGNRAGGYDSSGDIAAGAALGVLLGMFAPVSPVAVPLVLLPASYLQRAARGRALRHAAEHDPKTQLLNHAAWQTLSSAALASHRTPTHSAAVLMVDLDHFKRLNDTYGHQAGDDVLTCVAHVLQTSTRRNDIVARFGGEEFSILLPGVTEQEACQAAERIRDQIAALTVITTDLHGHPVTISGITASIGVATTHKADDTSVDDLLVNADRWLYQAKERGRNRVCGPELASAA